MKNKLREEKYLKKVEGSRHFSAKDMIHITRVCNELWEDLDDDCDEVTKKYLNIFEAGDTIGWTLCARYEGLTDIEKKLFIKGIKQGYKKFIPY